MWVRGLKQQGHGGHNKAQVSHPMWVRGLKLVRTADLNVRARVAPYVGAWIETKSNCDGSA